MRRANESSPKRKCWKTKQIPKVRLTTCRQGITLTECLEGAYNEIKDRKGTLLPSGVFVKESVTLDPIN
jgi:hypothetical protein